jgi:hypothetical protein
MPFNFEKFSDTESSFNARVSIRRTGQFGFNSGAANKYRLNDFPFVVLYFDSTKRAIGLEFQMEKVPGAVELNRNPSNIFIRSKNFCDRYGIDYAEASRYPLRRDDGTGFLYFELEEGEKGEENASDELPLTGG